VHTAQLNEGNWTINEGGRLCVLLSGREHGASVENVGIQGKGKGQGLKAGAAPPSINHWTISEIAF
jgi:hypothetical protein